MPLILIMILSKFTSYQFVDYYIFKDLFGYLVWLLLSGSCCNLNIFLNDFHAYYREMISYKDACKGPPSMIGVVLCTIDA